MKKTVDIPVNQKGIQAKESRINEIINKLPKKLRNAFNKISGKTGEKIRGILERVILNPAEGALLLAKLPFKYKIMLLLAGAYLLNKNGISQTNPNRGQNELNVIQFHALTDPSCTALGMDDNQEKLTTHAMITQDYLNATDTRLIDMSPFCRVDQEPTTDIVGSGNESTDMLNFKNWLWDSSHGASINDVQYFYTNYTPAGYEESSYNGEDENGFCRALFNGAYDDNTAGGHALGHWTAAVDNQHHQARYDATYTMDMTSIGIGIVESSDGESIVGMDNYPGGNAYQAFYCTPEAYNKDTPANGGDGYYYYDQIDGDYPSWIATDQMNNVDGFVETTTGIYNFLIANPEKIQEETVAPLGSPVAVINNGIISLGNIADFNVEYPNTTATAYMAIYYTSGKYTMYLYEAGNSGDGQFIAGPVPLDSSFSNISAGDYVLRIYEEWANGLSAVSNTLTIDNIPPTPTMTTSEPDPTNAVDFVLNISFDEDINQSTLTLSDFVTDNCNVSNLVWVDGANCDITVTPNGDGNVGVDLPQDSCEDLNGNGNNASTFDIESDQTDPIPDLFSTEPSTTNNIDGFYVDLDFNNEDNVDGVDISDFYTEKCTISSLTGGGNEYQFLATPTAEGQMIIRYEVAGCDDDAGNLNVESDDFSRNIDWTNPDEIISDNNPEIIGGGTYTATIDFNENVNGFTMSDITAVNATLSNFQIINNNTFTVNYTPIDNGYLSLSIDSYKCEDEATNPNNASNILEKTVNLNSPYSNMNSTAPNPTNADTVLVNDPFSEPVNGFTESDLIVNNGELIEFTQVDDSTWTMKILPENDGVFSITTPAGVCTSSATGNENVADYWESTSDRTRPQPVITGVINDDGTVNITFTFPEPVVNFDETDPSITSGVMTEFTGSGSVYTALITPEGQTCIVNVDENVCEDIPGNLNEAADPYQIVIDGIETNWKKLKNFNIYPNPSHNLVHIKTIGEIRSVEVYDETGKLVILNNHNEHSNGADIDVSELAKGLYFVMTKVYIGKTPVVVGRKISVQ